MVIDEVTEVEVDEVESGECPTCGPDQVADVDGFCSWCGRPLALTADPRADRKWWTD